MFTKDPTDERYLSERQRFAAELGWPELFTVIDHFPLYAGIQTLARTIAICDLLRSTVGVDGDVVEFGCWEGANLVFLAKMLSVFEPLAEKKVYGFDSFEGLQSFSKEDGFSQAAIAQLRGRYRGARARIASVIDLYELGDTISIVPGDACLTVPAFFAAHHAMKISFAFCDFDLYGPTITALNEIHPAMTAGGLIVLDQATSGSWIGESAALAEFLAGHPGKYAPEAIPHARQPTVALRRLT